MRKILKGAGAATLAAATVVTGLSFGPAALAAPAATPSAKASTNSVPADGTEFKLVFQDPKTNKWWGESAPGSTTPKSYETRALAEANSATLTTIASSNATGSFSAKYSEGPTEGACIGSARVNPTYNIGRYGCGTSESLFTIDGLGRMVATQHGNFYFSTTTDTVAGGTRVYKLSSTNPAARFQNLNLGMQANVDSVDVLNQSAQLSGSGKPNSVVIIGDDQEAPVDGDGKWSATVEGLAFGENTIHLENWVGATKDSEKDITVTVKAADITGVASSTSTVTDDITISGQGQPGADIKIADASGNTVATTTVNASTGRYNQLIPAPNAAGTHTFTVTQSIKDTNVGSTPVSFDYGTGVSVTSPVDDFVHPGGPLNFAGKGEADSPIQIKEEGKPGVVATGKVLANGNWTIKNVDLDNAEHKLVVSQTSEGNNVTTDKLTLNPGQTAAPAAPTAKVTLESNVSSKALVSGTGIKGATISIKNGTTEIGTAKVLDNGTWSTRINPIGAGSHTLTVTQTVNGVESAGATATVDYGQALAVTSPIDDQIVTGQTTFTGTGAAGSEIVVRAGNRVPVCKVTMVTAGAWSCTDTNNILPMGKYNVLVEQVAKGGLITTAMASMEKLPVGYTAPTVTTPGNGSSVSTPLPTITGNATPNATIRVKNAAGTTIIDTRADGNGKWSKTVSAALTTGANALTVTQIVNPGGHTDTINYTVTVTNAAPLTVTSPINSQLVAGNTITTGTGQNGATVQVMAAGGMVVGTDTVTNGTWSITDTTGLLPMGTFNYGVKMTVDGVTTTAVASMKHVPANYTAATVTSPASGSTVVGSTPLFMGTATPNATIRIKNAAGTVVAQTMANGNGGWTAPTTVPLALGSNPLELVQIINPGGVTITSDYTLTIQ